MSGKFVRFKVQPGKQTLLLAVPYADVLYGGARGGGKSMGVLGFFDAHQAKYGVNAKGLLIRRTYPELDDIVNKAKSLFTQREDPAAAKWEVTKRTLLFPNGATLKFRYLDRDRDAERYQGHEFTLIIIEEAGNFPSPVPIDKLRACLRSAVPGIKKYFLLTCNPGGAGHNWLKAAYIDPSPSEVPFWVEKKLGFEGHEQVVRWQRIFISAKLTDNQLLMENDPGYIANLVSSAGDDPALLAAWLEGRWDIIAGGLFDKVWSADDHILEVFQIPLGWKVYRCLDWGSSSPFDVGYYTISQGDYIKFESGEYRTIKKGSIIRISEWYGWSGVPNVGLKLLESEFIEKMLQREEVLKKRWNFHKVYNGPADSAIFVILDGDSIAKKHAKLGVKWSAVKKGKGSRIAGWQEMREMLWNAKQRPQERAGLFCTVDCPQFIRTIPTLQRDLKNTDDCGTDMEDHCADNCRYFIQWSGSMSKVVKIKGF